MVFDLKDLSNKNPPKGGLCEFLTTYTAVNVIDESENDEAEFLTTYTAVN